MRKFSIIMMALVLAWSATASNQPPIKDRLMTVEKALLPLTNAYKAESTAKVAAAPAETIDLTFDNTGDLSFQYYATDGDWYLGWPDVTNTYIVRFDYVVGFEGKFGHYSIADLDLDYSFLSDYSSGARKDVNYTDADFTIKDEGNDTWSLSGYVVCEDGNTYNLSGYYEKPQSETYDVELTELVSAYYYDFDADWYFKVANSEYSFTLDLVSESGMFAGEYTTEDAIINYCSVRTLTGSESVESLEISIVAESLVEPLEIPAAFELTGSIVTTKGNTYNVHLTVTAPLEPKQVINANVECVEFEWPTSDYPGVAGRFSFMDTDVPSRAFEVAVAQPVGEFTVSHGIVKEYTCMVENSTMMPYMVDNGTVSVTPDAEKMVLVVDAQLVCADTIQYNFTSEIPVKFDSYNVFTITYTAAKKLTETTDTYSSGLHTNAFNVSIISHTFSDGIGTITFVGEVTSIGKSAFRDCSGLTSITIPNSVTSIGDDAFYYCYGLTSITIPNSVTSIGNSAFEGCFGLTSITIPNSVTSIGNSAFEGCFGLTSIVVESGNTNYDSRDNCNAIIKTSTNTLIAGCNNTVIPNSVTSIGDYAFRSCSGLTSITIPNSVTSIGNRAFHYCSGLTSIVVELGNTNYDSRDNCNAIIETSTNTLITGCKNTTIPNSVTSIGDHAFSGCSGLTSITIPNSVTSIGGFAFSDCSGLTSITIPNSVTSIGDDAFYYCSGLTSITIPNSVTSIGESAFCGCSGLTSITIPNSVTGIGYAAFRGCSGLTSITSEAVTPPSCGLYCFDRVDHSITVYVPAASVGAYKTAAEWKDFTNIQAIQATTQNTITYTAAEKLTETTDANTSGLHPNAFNVSITSHTFSNGTGTITFSGEVTSIGESAFHACTGLTSITIPNSVTSIGESAFHGCTGLTSITIPNSVTSIGKAAFYYCSGLTSSLTIPNSVTSIGTGAFAGCSGLTSIVVESGNTNYDSRDNCNAIIKTSTNTIIAGCKNTTIPNSVTSIGESAFPGCTGLTSLTIPNSVTSIGNSAFWGCSGLTSITIPNTVTDIGYWAFWGCSGLTTIVIESGNTKYDSRDNCNAIIEKSTNTLIVGCQNTVIPNSVTSIGDDAFEGCSGLSSITIPNSVTSIGDWAFYLCSGLTSITIPNTVTSIGRSAFYYCSGLTSITSEAVTPPSCGSSCFYDVDHSIPVYVPAASVGAYKTATEWKDFTNIQAIQATTQNTITYTATEKLTETTSTYSSGLHTNAFNVSITSHTFSNGTGTITFSGEVASIGNNAFYYCSGLTSITIPNSVTSIGDDAFYYCRGLTSITIPNSVTSIGYLAFYGCSGLTSIIVESLNSTFDSRDNCNAIIKTSTNTLIAGCKNTVIPNSVTSIGDWAFYLCSGLTSITIPNSVTSIGKYAFGGCSGLTSITIPNSVTIIGYEAFCGCSGLTSIVVESGNTNYDSRDNCNAIIKTSTNTLIAGCNNTVIPNSVTSIGESAFSNCSGLTSITIPNSVTSIGDNAFYYCSGLTSITIPNSVTSIGRLAFEGCSGLTSITIPNSVTSIGDYAFRYCSGLTSITSEAVTPPSCGSSCFNRVDHSIPVYVPAASVGAYKTAKEWMDFTNIQAIQATTHTLTVLSSNETLGSVMGSGEFALDTTVTIAALCKMDIVFSGWSDGNTDNPRQVTLTSDSTITAYFKEVEEAEYTIEVSAYNPALGTATASELVLVEAVPYSGCSFVCWSDGNAENPRYIPLTGDINLQAIFSGTPTSVAETTDKAQGIVRKVIVDGQLHIIRDDKTYTVEGVLVE